MKVKIFIGIFIAAMLTMQGCTTVYTLKKIPDTPANRQAFRDCQHTLAVATGYDSAGYIQLFKNCTATIESTTATVEEYPASAPAGCQEIQMKDDVFYYFCK